VKLAVELVELVSVELTLETVALPHWAVADPQSLMRMEQLDQTMAAAVVETVGIPLEPPSLVVMGRKAQSLSNTGHDL
jgi:hypothetical protein